MTNQPIIPPVESVVDAEQPESAPTPDQPDEGLIIQDTPVIDATQLDTEVGTPEN
ncbi:MAG: hypothetical protein QM582_06805 [Micropruina sp.]|uniref:hypothetical protein n=1 Tax=Micropruina sp. TaxID=2737536 RepID=UPI0039E45BA5